MHWSSRTYPWHFTNLLLIVQSNIWNLLPRSFKDGSMYVLSNMFIDLWSSKQCRCRLYCQICILQRVSPHEDVKGTLHHSAALAARKVHLHSPSSGSLSLRRYGGAGASRLRALPARVLGVSQDVDLEHMNSQKLNIQNLQKRKFPV